MIPELGRSPGGISLAWEIPWTEEPSGLQSMGLLKSQTQLSKNVHMHTVHDTEPPWVQASLLLAFFMYARYYQPPAPLLAITLLGPLCNLSLVALSVAYLGFMHHFNYTYGPGYVFHSVPFFFVPSAMFLGAVFLPKYLLIILKGSTGFHSVHAPCLLIPPPGTRPTWLPAPTSQYHRKYLCSKPLGAQWRIPSRYKPRNAFIRKWAMHISLLTDQVLPNCLQNVCINP